MGIGGGLEVLSVGAGAVDNGILNLNSEGVMNSASFHARVVVASCGMSVVVELGSALSSMFARSGLMRLFMFIWPMIWVGIRACQGLGGAGADGIPPCPEWENRPWWWLRFKEPPGPTSLSKIGQAEPGRVSRVTDEFLKFILALSALRKGG